MTEIFNNAYNQANQILDGSGLSSVIHKQEGGSFNTYDRALEAWKKDATRGIDDMAIDTTAAFKHGGKITSGGLIQLAEGSTRSDPYWDSIKERYNVEKMSDKKLADVLAREDILRSSISDEDLRKSGLVRIRTRPWAISQGEEFERRKGGDKTAHIRKLYYLSLKRLLNEVKQNADRTGNSFPYEKMQRIVDKGMSETFPEGYVESIAPEYMGQYGMHLEPGDSQDFKDAYLGGGIPGPSFVPNKEQTAPVFESSSFEEIWDEIMRNKEDQAQSKKEGGGLAGIKKSININGQPHKLAWINSDEASALKAMGGSGKKVGGIPAYWLGGVGDWDAGVDEDDWGIGGSVDEAGSTDTSNYVDASTDTPGTRGPEDYSWNWMPSGKTWRYDYSTDPRAEGPGPGYGDFVPASAETPETKAYFDKRAKDLARDATILDVDDYKAQVIAFAQHKYNKNAQMKHMFDREAPKVLDQMAEDYDLPLWGIGLRSMDDLGAGEPLHYWQYSGYTDKDGNKIPGAIDLAHEGYYGGEDPPWAKGLASLAKTLLIPGGNVIEFLTGKIKKGFHKNNPNDPRYWPKHERSLKDAHQAVLNEQRDKKEGIEKGFVASGKELIDMYKLGSDDTTTKLGFTPNNEANVDAMDASADMVNWAIAQTKPEAKKDGTNTKPYTPADIINYNYDDFWKDPSEELYQGNYKESPQKLRKLPQVKKDLTEEGKKEPTGMAALLAKRPEATSREDSNVYLGELLNQIYGKNLGQSMLG